MLPPPHAHTHTHMHAHTHRHTHVHTHAHTHAHTRAHTPACCHWTPPSLSSDAISPVTLAPVKLGVNGDIKTLYNIQKSSPSQFPTLQSMVLHELRTETNQTPPPATNAVQWVKRFVCACVSECVCMCE